MHKQRDVVLLDGKPGSGKSRMGSALAESLRSHLSIEHLSIGNHVRKVALGQVAVEASIRDVVAEHFNSNAPNSPLPNSLVRAIIHDTIRNADARILLIDGFPRYDEQIDDFKEIMDESSLYLAGELYAEATDEEAIRRITNRKDRPTSQAQAAWRVDHYNTYIAPVRTKLREDLGLTSIGISTADTKEVTDQIARDKLFDLLRK